MNFCQNFYCDDAMWHAKLHLGTLFFGLEFETPIVIIQTPHKRAKFCPNLPPKKTLFIYVSNNQSCI
jgi:hypothetical protein